MDQLNGNENQNHRRQQTKHSSSLPTQGVLIPVVISLILTWLAIFELKTILSEMGAMNSGLPWTSRIKWVYIIGFVVTVSLIGLLFIKDEFQTVRGLWLRVSRSRKFTIFWIFTLLVSICPQFISFTDHIGT